MPTVSRNRHHTKRHGQHQKRSSHFLKVYLPYVPLTVFLVTGLLISFLWKPTGNKGVLAYSVEMSGGALLTATNQQRAQNGAGSLTLNEKLSAAAQAKANDMAARNYWSHNTPEGNPPWIFISNAGYSYSRAGENLAYGFATSSETINTGWMNSTSHRENMLNKDYTEVGFGYTNASNYNNNGEQTIVVAMYATPLSAPTPAPAPAVAKTTPKQTTVTTTPEAPKTTRDVEVTVLDENNKPVRGIKVTLHSAPREAVTDNDGVALFKDVEQGEHTATAEIDGAKREQTLTVSSDTQKVSIELPAPKLSSNSTSSTATPVEPKKISRLEVITKGAIPWLASIMSALALLSGAYLLGKHSRSLHRLIVRGERYVLQHSILDVTILSFLWLCFVVSRTAGVIL